MPFDMPFVAPNPHLRIHSAISDPAAAAVAFTARLPFSVAAGLLECSGCSPVGRAVHSIGFMIGKGTFIAVKIPLEYLKSLDGLRMLYKGTANRCFKRKCSDENYQQKELRYSLDIKKRETLCWECATGLSPDRHMDQMIDHIREVRESLNSSPPPTEP